MNLWTIVFMGFTGCYTLLTLRLWLGWRAIPSKLFPTVNKLPFLTVVMVVRNEELNILSLLHDLQTQQYPSDKFEVLVVDDHSTDNTVAVARQFAHHSPFTLNVLLLAEYLRQPLPDGGYKKKAIEWAVSEAKGEWIVLTDGDCRVGSQWLQRISGAIRPGITMICGPVTFQGEKTVFQRMQTVEFASLIGSGAATLQMGFPTMCNAANLTFCKAAFTAVGGCQDTARTATGDDLFLMHKMHVQFRSSIIFLKHQQAIVRTEAKENWNDFYQQRLRWASKWQLYQDWRVTLLAVFVFLANVTLLAAFPLAMTGKILPVWLLTGLLLRFGSELLFLTDILAFLGQRRKIRWILPVQAVYFVYVVFFGVMAQKRGYVWKGRKLH